MAAADEKVSVYSGPAGEAAEVKALLEQKGIEAVLQDQTVPVDQDAGLLVDGGMDVARVLVPREDYEKAQRIVEAY
ncbi:MAG: DUF2007 domain-containing protein [Candidatus Brocadiia bacterium]